MVHSTTVRESQELAILSEAQSLKTGGLMSLRKASRVVHRP